MSQRDFRKGLSPHFHIAPSRCTQLRTDHSKEVLPVIPLQSILLQVSFCLRRDRIQKPCFHLKLETLFTDGQIETLNGLSGNPRALLFFLAGTYSLSPLMSFQGSSPCRGLLTQHPKSLHVPSSTMPVSLRYPSHSTHHP